METTQKALLGKNLRKIRKDEIKEVAKIMAEGFCDYPLYNVFFKNDKKKQKRIFYFFWYRIYTRRLFTYVTEDHSLAVSYKKPEDRTSSPLGLILNPSFFFGGLKNIPLKSLLLVADFGKMENEFQSRYYNPSSDCYAQAICVLKKSKGNGSFFQVLKELEDERAIFCETHTEENAKLYQCLGMEICAKTFWHGVPHFVMKKPASKAEK